MCDKNAKYVRTSPKDPPVEGGTCAIYFGIILEEGELNPEKEREGSYKIDWQNKKGSDVPGDILNFHFEEKWIGSQHFTPATYQEFKKWSEE